MHLVLPGAVRHTLLIALLLICKIFPVSSLSSVLLSYHVTVTEKNTSVVIDLLLFKESLLVLPGVIGSV